MNKIIQKNVVTTLRLLYPVWVLLGIFSLLYVPSVLIVYGDAELTSQNITANTFLFRLSIVSSLLTQILFIIIPLFLYKLFKSVNINHAVLMVSFALVSVPMTMYNELNKINALSFLDNPSQMMHFLKLSQQGIIISSIFWGLWLFPLGFLVYKSRFMPKFIGIVLIVAGSGYLIGSFANLLVPGIKEITTITDFFTFGEIIFILWLVIKGFQIKSSLDE